MTTDVPGDEQVFNAEVPVMATGRLLTFIVAVLFADKGVMQDELVSCVTVIMD